MMQNVHFSSVSKATCALTLSAVGLLGSVMAPTGLPAAQAAESAPLKELRALARQAEQTSERIHHANVELKRARDAERKAAADIVQAKKNFEEAENRRKAMQPSVNNIASLNLRGGQSIGVMTVLMAHSPQDILDQSRSEAALTQTTLSVINKYANAQQDAKDAEKEAEKNRKLARENAAKVIKMQERLDQQRRIMRKKITAVKMKFASLPPGLQEQWKTVSLPEGFDPQIAFGRNLLGNKALQIAMTRIGSPYVWGAAGPNAFDCSGLVYWAYRQIGIILPRSSQAMAAGGLTVPLNTIQPGDLVIYYGDNSHVGLYAGNGQVLHAPTFGQTVTLSPLHHAPVSTVRRY